MMILKSAALILAGLVQAASIQVRVLPISKEKVGAPTQPVFSTHSESVAATGENPERHLSDQKHRQERIEKILFMLDRVSAVGAQMNPDQAQWLEPVLEDLTERTVALGLSATGSGGDGFGYDELDARELSDIERTLSQLSRVINHMIEPEMSL